jgi:ubiquinone/menaquinone biosynthesis C-methylase UbiE
MTEAGEQIFAAAAARYDRYRLAYPDRLIGRVAALAGLEAGDRVLDLGCGTGMLAIAFARAGLAVTAMDPEPEMLEQARANVQSAGVTVTWRQGGSGDLDISMGPYRLVTIGRAFHWMDRAGTLVLLDKIVAPAGGIALFHDAHPPVDENNWFKVLCDMQRRYRGRREAGGHKRYEPFLLASAFTEIDGLSVTIRQSLSVEDIVGRAFSMSQTQKPAAARQAFAQDLAAALRDLSTDGKFTEVAELVAVLARRPNRPAA